MSYDWDWPAAEREAKRAVELGSHLPMYGFWLASHGRLPEALAALQRGKELDPLALPRMNELAACYNWMRQPDQAIVWGGTSAAGRQAANRAGRVAKLVNCFPSETLVATERGLRPIADVEAGEKVWAYDFQGGQWRLCEVECRQDADYDGTLVTLDFGLGEVTATAYHPFWVIEGQDLETRPGLRHVDISEDRGEDILHLAVGKVAPEIEGQDQDGTKFKLSDYRGKVVLLDFWHQY